MEIAFAIQQDPKHWLAYRSANEILLWIFFFGGGGGGGKVGWSLTGIRWGKAILV